MTYDCGHMAKTALTIQPIDERYEFAGTSRLRQLNAEELRTLNGRVIVIQDSAGKRLSALMSYEFFLVMARAAVGETGRV